MTDEELSDIRRVLTLCFRGIESTTDLDLERIISFDMEWLSPEDAEQAVTKMLDTGWLLGERNSLTLSFEPKQIPTPIGWFPRPSRLLEPKAFQSNNNSDSVKSAIEKPPTTKKEKEVHEQVKVITPSDPRHHLSERLLKYISKQTKISIDEVQRRAERKQKALGSATIWLCLALIAREQNLEMKQIVSALSS